MSQAKETLESAFRAYTGTILFVSHDRYFVRQVADAVLIFEDQSVMYYPFGYEHYLERRRKMSDGPALAAQIKAEEQALIAGMRSVPKAERHRLKEIPAEEAYADWKMRLVREQLEEASQVCSRLDRQMRTMWDAWICSEGFWTGASWLQKVEYESLKSQYEDAFEQWHCACMEWLDTALEVGL